jgi:hypothetical protein
MRVDRHIVDVGFEQGVAQFRCSGEIMVVGDDFLQGRLTAVPGVQERSIDREREL